jgi:class 3 adenylate cyclase/tetratricopeptide (TPR) repeat protein
VSNSSVLGVSSCHICAAENPLTNKFCGGCGTQLPDTCPSCGSEIPAGNNFCGNCGFDARNTDQPSAVTTPVSEKNQPAVRDGAPAREAALAREGAAERRHLTVMFCDLADSTELSGQLDPEDLRDVIAAYQSAAAAQIEKWGGYIARYMGDGILVYFGYPQAHEDDPERAVHAGLDIIAKVNHLDVRPDLALHVRIGVATGVVVAGDIIGEGASEERVVLGVTPNLAARLQSLAEYDTVVISDRTHRLTGGFFDYEDLGPHQLKGIKDPENAWRVTGTSQTTSRFEATTEAGLSPLVGREEEISLLLGRWRQCKSGEGQVVMLSGEAGVGKSRIVEAFCRRIENEDHGTITLSCSPFHSNTALYPIIGCLERVMNIERQDPAALRLQKLDDFVSACGLETDDIVPFVASVMIEGATLPEEHLGGTPEQQRRLVWDALLSLLEAQTRQRPLIMIGEDIHWIDPSTQEFCSLLIERLRDLALLLVLSTRPEYQAPWLGHPHVTTFTLNRLSRSDSEALIRGIAGAGLPDNVLNQIIERTDGVPLFAEELTKTVLESGSLELFEGNYRLAGKMQGIEIPGSLHDSLMARLDRMAPVKEVAQIAAVIGRQFDEDILAEVCQLDLESLRAAVEQLIEADLIVRQSLPPSATFQFKHALVQDTAYESLLKATRQRYHLDVAKALAARRDGHDQVGHDQVPAEILAHHYSEAQAPEQAVPLWKEAANRAGERWANAEAVGHLERGLEMTASMPQSPKRTALELPLLLDLIAGLRILDRYPDALEALEKAEVAATTVNDDEALAHIHYMRGNIYFPMGNLDGCLHEHEQAQQFARKAASPAMEARALSGLGDAWFMRGHLITAHDSFQACLAVVEQHGLTQIEPVNRAMYGHSKLYLLELDEALKNAMMAAELAVKAGNVRAEMVARGSSGGKILFDRGEYQEARKQLGLALDIAAKIGARRFEPVNLAVLTQIELVEGNRAKAVDMARKAVAISRETGIRFAGPLAMGALAMATDSEEERRLAISEGMAVLEQGCVGHSHIWFYRNAMDALLAAENWEGAEAIADAAEEYISPQPIPWMNIIIRRARVMASMGRGQVDDQTISEARQVLDDAQEKGFIAIIPGLKAALSRAAPSKHQ